MKKHVLLFAAALLINGFVCAQTGWYLSDPPNLPGELNDNTPSALRGGTGGLGGLSGTFYAIQTQSTNARYSVGMFTSDVDGIMDINYYKPKIGTFIFLGGYPANNSVDDTYPVTPEHALSFGLGKTLGRFYLGVQYSGSLARAGGSDSQTSAQWANNFAVLFGTPEAGAFRFDMKLNTDSRTTTKEGSTEAKRALAPPSFALTWGTRQFFGTEPYITFGMQFPEKYTYSDVSSKPYKEAAYASGYLFGFNAGVNRDVGERSAIWGELAFKKLFKGSFEGDKDAVPAGFFGTNTMTGSGDTFSLAAGGAYGLSFRAAIKSVWEFGKFTLGFKPSAAIGFTIDDTGIVNGDPGVNQYISDTLFELVTQLSLGVKFQASEKIYLFSGISLQVFDWRTRKRSAAYIGESSRSSENDWLFNGFEWSSWHWASQNGVNALGYGMTITPIKNLVIGFGLNTILDKFFFFNLEAIRIEGGTIFDGEFGKLQFDLTISYKF